MKKKRNIFLVKYPAFFLNIGNRKYVNIYNFKMRMVLRNHQHQQGLWTLDWTIHFL